MIEEIERFIVSELASDRESFEPDQNLLSEGIIDSMGILKLVSFLEERFEIQAGDEDLVPENFESLNAMRAFVELKRSGR